MSLREAKKQRARQDILAAARELIDADGYEQTTMRDIAAAAELSYQTLYNYFPTKALILQALLLEDVNHVAAAMDALVAEHAAGNRPLLPTLHAMFREDLDAVSQRDRESWRVVAVDYMQQQGEAAHLYELIDAKSHENLLSLLESARAQGELVKSVDPQLLADTLFSISYHAVWRYILEPSTAKSELLAALEAQTSLLLTPYLQRQPTTFG